MVMPSIPRKSPNKLDAGVIRTLDLDAADRDDRRVGRFGPEPGRDLHVAGEDRPREADTIRSALLLRGR